MKKYVQIHPQDNVVVVIESLQPGETIAAGARTITVKESIPAGHKVAIAPISRGSDVVKYGFPIGAAKVNIEPGEWVHTERLQSKLAGLVDYRYEPNKKSAWQPDGFAPKKQSFWGYARPDGQVGIRNEVWIIPTVGCVNAIARVIESRAQAMLTGKEHVDGIFAFNHPYGCSQIDEDLEKTQQFLASLVHHPNAGAVLVLSLGCENNTLASMQKAIGSFAAGRVKFLVCQDCEDEIEAGVAAIRELIDYADKCQRTLQPASKLVIGLKCGGSDGFSGITANALAGQVSNIVAAAGGTAILTEVPEMFGAETLLMNRAVNEEIFQKIVQLINGFKEYYMRYGKRINENPSPGNKAGGITTLEEKSLGCVQKGGVALVTDVLAYGQRVKNKRQGLLLLESPGNDLVAANALAAAGAQLILFTTGRGTPFAAPVPTVKIASNSKLATRKKNWLDFNAGMLLEGASLEELGERFWNYMLAVASGQEKTVSEHLDKHELAIFKDGVCL